MAKAGKKNKGEKEDRNGGRMAGVGIIAALLLLGGGLGYSALGLGDGSGEGQKQQTVATSAPEQDTDRSASSGQEDKEIPETIVVKISEKTVTINDNPVSDKEELKKYILEYNSDTRKFVLDDKNSILAEYKWVNEAFSELGITLGVN